MSNVAINRETGEILVVGPDGQWSPAQRAVNPQTGEQIYNDGTRWVPVPVAPPPPRTATAASFESTVFSLNTCCTLFSLRICRFSITLIA